MQKKIILLLIFLFCCSKKDFASGNINAITVIASKEDRAKRREAEKLEAKKFRQKIRRYSFVALMIIVAIVVILKG